MQDVLLFQTYSDWMQDVLLIQTYSVFRLVHTGSGRVQDVLLFHTRLVELVGQGSKNLLAAEAVICRQEAKCFSYSKLLILFNTG